MKKRVFKKWVDKTISCICALSFFLIATTIESDFTIQYLIFLVINLLTFVSSAYLLVKFGRD